MKEAFVAFIQQLQNDICIALENIDGIAKFTEDKWQRPGGGGGKSRIMQNGEVFEKGGVNISEVQGQVTDVMKKQLHINGSFFFATGISLVIHPYNPYVPTVHANFRYFELYDNDKNIIDNWFGGGADLTPYYLFNEDAVHFHNTFKNACDLHDENFYPLFKKQCDEYFVNRHRNNEARGIGGIFYDYLRADDKRNNDFWFSLSKACGNAFVKAYLPIVEKRKNTSFKPQQKYWQEIRRGRYVEFNLVHDRGTLFGLKTNGRTESILMSLPPTVRFDYNYTPTPGSEEDKLLQVCMHPKNWLNINTEDEVNAWVKKVNSC
jgi:coproporphyrinogen III oxidase